MSKLHDLTVDLGIEVDKFTSKIEEEKRKIMETKARFDRQLKDRAENEAQKTRVSAELEELLKTCFVDRTASCRDKDEKTLGVLPYLTKALGEIRAGAERIRDERMEVLTQYKAKIDNCDAIFNKNRMLESFFETWKKNIREGKELVGVPNLIRQISEEVASYYEVAPHKIIEESIKANQEVLLCGDAFVSEEPTKQTKMKSHLPTAVPALLEDSSMVLETPLVRSQPKNGAQVIEPRESVDFSRLVDFDTTLTESMNQGLYSDEALRKLIKTSAMDIPKLDGDGSECSMDHENTLL